jgi:hypothetical protein
LVAAAVLAFFGWQQWEAYSVETAATDAVEEAAQLIQKVEKETQISSFEEEYQASRQSYLRARGDLEEKNFSSALTGARRSVNMLSSILSAVHGETSAGEAQIISLAGRVEVKRSEYSDWEDARPRTTLRDGNYLRTSRTGSAEILFADGTLYFVRPNTLFRASPHYGEEGKEGQSIRMEYGWVDLATNQQPSMVETPEAEAQVRRDSSGSVTYDRTAKAGRFSSFKGGMRVATANGKVLELGALEEAVQSAGDLSDAYTLPDAPALVAPEEGLERKNRGQLQLAWQAVAGAARYALQISRNPLFVDTIIDTDQRTKTTAAIGLRGEGTFAWRVAAVDREGRQGPWSTTRRFRVVADESSRRSDRLRDDEPPRLSLNQVQPYGSLFIITGQTEPGAKVSIRGELVNVGADGAFAKTLQINESGFNFVDVRATDAYGNEAKQRLRLYVEHL